MKKIATDSTYTKTTIGKIKDGESFVLSMRKNAAKYTLNRKKKGVALITAFGSSRTYEKSTTTVCYFFNP